VLAGLLQPWNQMINCEDPNCDHVPCIRLVGDEPQCTQIWALKARCAQASVQIRSLTCCIQSLSTSWAKSSAVMTETDTAGTPPAHTQTRQIRVTCDYESQCRQASPSAPSLSWTLILLYRASTSLSVFSGTPPCPALALVTTCRRYVYRNGKA